MNFSVLCYVPPPPVPAPAARFDMIHPKTAEWHARREQCRRCERHISAGGDRCTAAPGRFGNGTRTAGFEYDYCVDTREPGAACGPDATLFRGAE